jgi:DNA polymerase-1
MNDKYSSNDAWITHELFRKILPEFIEQGFDGPLWEVEQKYVWVIANMIELGIKIDLEYCLREMFKGQHIMGQMRAELMFNPGSSNGLEKFLIDDLGLPIVKTTPKGKPSFDKEAMAIYDKMLERVDDDRAKKVLRYRGWQKTVSSNYKAYIDLRDGNNVLHPGYKIHGTETGRASCEQPNLQQIPKSSDKEWNGNLKRAFVPRTGFQLWEVDYSQLEFRLTCAYAEQAELLEIFNDDSRDIFDEMAAAMDWLRQNVKTLVYLILFGGGANRAKEAFRLETIEEGRALVEEFHGRYPEIRRISRKAQNLATSRGYVQYWTGRRRHFPKGSKFYRAFNSIIQGGEAEIVKRAMIKLEETVCDESCRMVLQVHDSVVFEIAEGKESLYLPRIKEAMEAVDFDFGVRFKVDAKRWGEK